MKTYGFLATFLITAIFTSLVIVGILLLLESIVLDLSIRQILQGNFFTQQGLWVGVAFGMAFGYVNAISLAKTTIKKKYDDKALFEVKMINIFVTMGYHPLDTKGSDYIFKPSGSVVFFAGKIFASLSDGQAVISGPRAYITRFNRKFKDNTNSTIISPDK